MRALYAAYDGPLYQVIRESDNTSMDIKTMTAGGPADAAAQDAFCAGTSCIVEQFYDQSPYKNHIAKYFAPLDCPWRGYLLAMREFFFFFVMMMMMFVNNSLATE